MTMKRIQRYSVWKTCKNPELSDALFVVEKSIYKAIQQLNLGICLLNREPPLKLRVRFHRYECQSCGNTFNEDIDTKYPGTRVTWKAALWIKALLKLNMTVKAVSLLTDIHWETISKIHKELMDDELEKRKAKLETDGYKPKHLAVDEFAIHKGHTYATCVMDLDEGDVLWFGKGRAINDFRKFFEEIE